MKKIHSFIFIAFVFTVIGCTQKVRNEYSVKENSSSQASGNSNNSTPTKEEKTNSIGIPVKLPYSSDLEALYQVNCKLNNVGSNGPDQALMEERGKIITRLEDYEKKYKGKELEDFLHWGSVAANAVNNCP